MGRHPVPSTIIPEKQQVKTCCVGFHPRIKSKGFSPSHYALIGPAATIGPTKGMNSTPTPVSKLRKEPNKEPKIAPVLKPPRITSLLLIKPAIRVSDWKFLPNTEI
jgi:hypothetical protein